VGGGVLSTGAEGDRGPFRRALDDTLDGLGYVHTFNGPHSLFSDTIRSMRAMAVSHDLGHVLMGEQDLRISLLERLLAHAESTARYNVYFGAGRDRWDERGRTVHESIFNVTNGRYRNPSTQQGYTPFSTWTRGLAWVAAGYPEELEWLRTRPDEDFEAIESPLLLAELRRLAPEGLTLREAVEARWLQTACAVCDFHLENTPTDGVPYWDTGAPGLTNLPEWRDHPADPYNQYEPVDSSGRRITAQGLLRLAAYLEDEAPRLAALPLDLDGSGPRPHREAEIRERGERYRRAALVTARTLFAEPYLSSGEHEGILLHSIYHQPNGWDFVQPGQTVAKRRELHVGGLPSPRARRHDRPGRSRRSLPAFLRHPGDGVSGPTGSSGRIGSPGRPDPVTDLRRFALHTITTRPWAIERAIDEYSRAGFGGISIWRDAMDGRDAGQIRRRMSEAGLAGVSLVRGGFFAHADETARAAAMEDNRRCIDEAHELDLPLIVLVCGADPALGARRESPDYHRLPGRTGTGGRRRWGPPRNRTAPPRCTRTPAAPSTPSHRRIASPGRQMRRQGHRRAPRDRRRWRQRGPLHRRLPAHRHPPPSAASWTSTTSGGTRIFPGTSPSPERMTFSRRTTSVTGAFPRSTCSSTAGSWAKVGSTCPPIRRSVEEAGFRGLIEVEIFSERYWELDQNEWLRRIAEACTTAV
jgi:hypothetical protein